MGCFWSSDDCERCHYCNRKAVNDLIIVNNICQICNDITRRTNTNETQKSVSGNGPYYGEFKCKSCGRYWDSRLCWLNTFQNCMNCRTPVQAFNFRSLNKSDMMNSENKKEHPKELCHMCKRLGHYCGMNKKKQYA